MSHCVQVLARKKGGKKHCEGFLQFSDRDGEKGRDRLSVTPGGSGTLRDNIKSE